MQKDIDLKQIIQVLNFTNSQQEHTSFRLSDDYQPSFTRYSKEDENQEITFNLSNQQEDPQMKDSNQNELKITEVSPKDKIAFILEESKEESATHQTQPKLPAITKKTEISKKQTIKASERIKNKISLRKDSDQFTKKYDDLFDQIFFKEKQKEKKQELKKQQQPQDKKENSLLSTNNQNLQSSNVSTNSEQDLSISRAIDQALINLFNTSTRNEPKSPNSKVDITSECKLIINIIPPKEYMVPVAPPIEINNAKAKIRIHYGQTEATISSKKDIFALNVPYHLTQQRRIPKFMVAFRNKTNSYPNFYAKNSFNQQVCSQLNKQFATILQQCSKAIKTLKQSHLRLHELFTNIRQLYKRMSVNILNRHSQQDHDLIAYFLSQDWKSYINVEELDNIKPRDHFIGRPFNELQFITLLHQFQEIISKLQVDTILNAENPETIKAYMFGRNQLWEIQKNLRLYSEDLYLYSLTHFNLPSHYIESHKLLTALANNQEVVFDQGKDILLKNILFLQERKDVFGSSWLGVKTVECICNLKK